MLFQLAGSPVQRRGLRYTSAAHEATIITLPPPPFTSPLRCQLFPIRAFTYTPAVLMFCITQTVNTSASVKAISQKEQQRFMALIISRLARFYSALHPQWLWIYQIYVHFYISNLKNKWYPRLLSPWVDSVKSCNPHLKPLGDTNLYHITSETWWNGFMTGSFSTTKDGVV